MGSACDTALKRSGVVDGPECIYDNMGVFVPLVKLNAICSTTEAAHHILGVD